VIHYTKKTVESVPIGIEPIVIQVPNHFPYKDSKVVRWKYDAQVIDHSKPASTVTNIVGVGRMTQSGRVYTPPELRKEPIETQKKRDTGKEKLGEPSFKDDGLMKYKK